MENFVLYDEIGSGDKRTVYKGRRKGTVSYVAIHCVEKVHRPLIQNNVRVSYELSHPNVVQFHEWYETTNHLWLVVELCAGDSLSAILSQDGYLPEKQVKEFGMHVVRALVYLHAHQDIVYGNLCPGNVLLDADGTLKLSNFCLSRFADMEDDDEEDENVHEHDDSMSGQSTEKSRILYYQSPELLKGEETVPTKQSDFWALGCLLYEMFTGSAPYNYASVKHSTTDVSMKDEIYRQITESKMPYPMQGRLFFLFLFCWNLLTVFLHGSDIVIMTPFKIIRLSCSFL